jgi:predicted type IV restriction endonuclease
MIHNIIQAISLETTDPDRVVIRDAKLYCAVIFDNNNRKPIARLRLDGKQKSFSFVENGVEEKINIEKLSDIYKYRARIMTIISLYAQ